MSPVSRDASPDAYFLHTIKKNCEKTLTMLKFNPEMHFRMHKRLIQICIFVTLLSSLVSERFEDAFFNLLSPLVCENFEDTSPKYVLVQNYT